MNKITALLTTSLVLCFAGVHADQNVQVGERPFPHAEWVAIQELRAQKATEENAETIKLEQLIPDGKELPKTKVSLDFLKKKRDLEVRYGPISTPPIRVHSKVQWRSVFSAIK